MKKRKLILFGLCGATIFSSIFLSLLATQNSIEFKDNIDTAMSIKTKLDQFQDKYIITDYSKKDEIVEKAINEVSEYAKTLQNQDKILSFKVNNDSVTITNKCNVTMVFSPTVEGTYSGKTVLNYTSLFTNLMIYNELKEVTEGRQPLPEGFHNDSELLPSVSKDVANTFEHVLYDETTSLFKAIPLNKEFMTTLGPNQIVLMLGHGTYVEGYHSTLNTGRDFSWYDYQKDPIYREDCKNGLIIDTSGGEAFTTRYIDKYVSDLTNTFIYLGECEGAKDSALANSFLYKGAATIIANTEAISMRYGDVMQYTTIKNLTTKNDNGKYHTVEEALNIAREKYGECDPDLGHSRPTLFGNKNYSLETTIKAPVHQNNYTYTGYEIEFVKPGIGFHVKEDSPSKGIESGNYLLDVVLEDGYVWPDGSTTPSLEIGVNIVPKKTTFDDLLVIPEPITLRSTSGENVYLFTKGETDIGTITYYLDGSDDFYWTENVPYVNSPGIYNIAWRFEGDNNHSDLGIPHGFTYVVTVLPAEKPSPFPTWAIALISTVGGLIVIGAAALIIIKIKKHKKLSN